jgi:hypothetical protein
MRLTPAIFKVSTIRSAIVFAMQFLQSALLMNMLVGDGCLAVCDAFVLIVLCFEDFVEIDALGWCGAKGCVLLRRNVEVPVNTPVPAIDDGEDPGFVVVRHGGDDSGRHQGEDSRRLEMQ